MKYPLSNYAEMTDFVLCLLDGVGNCDFNPCYQNLGQYFHINDDKSFSSFIIKARFWLILLINEPKQF